MVYSPGDTVTLLLSSHSSSSSSRGRGGGDWSATFPLELVVKLLQFHCTALLEDGDRL